MRWATASVRLSSVCCFVSPRRWSRSRERRSTRARGWSRNRSARRRSSATRSSRFVSRAAPDGRAQLRNGGLLERRPDDEQPHVGLLGVPPREGVHEQRGVLDGPHPARQHKHPRARRQPRHRGVRHCLGHRHAPHGQARDEVFGGLSLGPPFCHGDVGNWVGECAREWFLQLWFVVVFGEKGLGAHVLVYVAP